MSLAPHYDSWVMGMKAVEYGVGMEFCRTCREDARETATPTWAMITSGLMLRYQIERS